MHVSSCTNAQASSASSTGTGAEGRRVVWQTGHAQGQLCPPKHRSSTTAAVTEGTKLGGRGLTKVQAHVGGGATHRLPQIPPRRHFEQQLGVDLWAVNEVEEVINKGSGTSGRPPLPRCHQPGQQCYLSSSP